MKKILFGILTFLGIGLSFCSAGRIDLNMSVSELLSIPINGVDIGTVNVVVSSMNFCPDFSEIYFSFRNISEGGDISTLLVESPGVYSIDYPTEAIFESNFFEVTSFCDFTGYIENPYFTGDTSEDTGSISTIDVYYNNGNSVENITCDGTQAIQINGLSTITSTNTFTPYYNISYTDEDNQKLIESYSNDILYLENGQFKKTYTGNNDWILSVQGDSESIFTGYIPTFDVTGSVDPNNEFTGNVFNNFADNSLKYLLSNIPSYIQYFIILLILFLILGFVKKFKRK